MCACLSVRMLATCVQVPVEGKGSRQIPWSRSQLQTVVNYPKLWVLGTAFLWKHRKCSFAGSHLSSQNDSKCYYLEINEELQTLLGLSMPCLVAPVPPAPSPSLLFTTKVTKKKKKNPTHFLRSWTPRRAGGHFSACQADIDFRAHTSTVRSM